MAKHKQVNNNPPSTNSKSRKNISKSLSTRIEAKVNDFDIKGAIKLLSSEDSLASFDDTVFQVLKKNTQNLPVIFRILILLKIIIIICL
jgi:hypothetical protein